MDALLNVDAVTSQYNLEGLRHLYDSVELQVQGLKALGVPRVIWQLVVIHLDEQATPGATPHNQEVADGEFDLDTLGDKLVARGSTA